MNKRDTAGKTAIIIFILMFMLIIVINFMRNQRGIPKGVALLSGSLV